MEPREQRREAVVLQRSHAIHSPSAAANRVSPEAAMLLAIGDSAGERVVIIGHDTLDLMCAVIREGAAEVTLLRLRERPEAHDADLAILVGLASAQEASCAVTQARRALAPTGRVVVRVASARLAADVGSVLRSQGFSDVRAIGESESGAVLTAELPFFGPLGAMARDRM